MALVVQTSDPKSLWNAVRKAISNDSAKTWKFHTDGVHFTHVADQWKSKAWFKSQVKQSSLVFNLVKSDKTTLTKEIYAEYHAKLLRLLLADFGGLFVQVTVTAIATAEDVVK